MKKYYFLIVTLLFSLTGYCCKCSSPDSTAEEYRGTDLVVYGVVISIDTVSLKQTIKSTKSGTEILQAWNKNDPDFLNRPFILAVKLKVIKNFKGAVQHKVTTIFTTRTGASCGYRYFAKGKEYIVFGQRKSYFLYSFTNYKDLRNIDLPNSYWTSNCSRTSEAYPEFIAELDGIKAGKPGTKR